MQSRSTSPKVILVTGGSSGIGRAIAGHLAAQGHRVYGTSRSAKLGDTLDGFSLVNLDVTDPDSIRHALSLIKREAGRLDVLINNAGLGMAGPIECTSDAEARELFDTNVFGVLNVCRQAIPLLRETGSAHLINITSIAGKVALPYRGIYAATKHAVEGLTESLSMEVKPFGIAVSILEPGDFKTNINATRRVAAQVDPKWYGPTFSRTLTQIEEEVETASDPILIAQVVSRILSSSSPRLRYRVGTRMQRLSVHIKYWLSGRMFERILMKHYDLD